MSSFVRTAKQKEACKVLSLSTFSMLYGGSRSGKSFIIIRAMIVRAMRVKSRHLIIRFCFNHAKTSIWHDTLPKVIDLCFPLLKPHLKFNNTDLFITFPNESQLWIGGIDDKERVEKILGTEYSTIFCNESSQVSYGAVQILMTRLAEKNELKKRFWFDANPPTKKHWTYQLFIEKKDPESGEAKSEDDYNFLLMNPSDNVQNISTEYMDMLQGQSKRYRDRFLHGLFLTDVIGALWTQTDIEAAKIKEHGAAKITVVAVDPAVTNNKNSDETGIIVISIDANGVGIVEADYTIKSSPNGWATVVVNAFHKHEANYVVAETNQGGDLVSTIIHSIDRSIKIKTVHASKGKFARAEPVAALYEQGKMAHCEGLELLENEMCEWVSMQSTESPNRIDALVWGVVALGLTTFRTSIAPSTVGSRVIK